MREKGDCLSVFILDDSVRIARTTFMAQHAGDSVTQKKILRNAARTPCKPFAEEIAIAHSAINAEQRLEKYLTTNFVQVLL